MSERVSCLTVKERPLPKGPLYEHPNAERVGDCGEGCCDDWECPDCGTSWRFEWPD